MRKIFLKTFIIALGLSIVPIKADAQFFKKLFGKKRKGGETEFCLRAVPLGGYVMIAGEDVEDDKVPKDRQMCNKGFFPRFIVLFAGAFFNFIFAFLILFYNFTCIKKVLCKYTFRNCRIKLKLQNNKTVH